MNIIKEYLKLFNLTTVKNATTDANDSVMQKVVNKITQQSFDIDPIQINGLEGTAYACMSRINETMNGRELYWKNKLTNEEEHDKYILTRIKDQLHTELIKHINFQLAEYGNAFIYVENNDDPTYVPLDYNDIRITEYTNGVLAYNIIGTDTNIPEEQINTTLSSKNILHFKELYTPKEINIGYPKRYKESIDLMRLEKQYIRSSVDITAHKGRQLFVLKSKVGGNVERLNNQRMQINANSPEYLNTIAAIDDDTISMEQISDASVMNNIIQLTSPDQIVNKLCRIWEVPKDMLDLTFNGKAAGRDALQAYNEQIIDPKLQYILNIFNRNLSLYSKTLKNYSIQAYPYYTNEEDLRADQQFRLENGLSTINDILIERGGEGQEVEGGDVRFIKSGLVPIDSLYKSEESNTNTEDNIR